MSVWKSQGLSNESVVAPSAFNSCLAPSLNYINSKIGVKIDGSWLKEEKITFTLLKSGE